MGPDGTVDLLVDNYKDGRFNRVQILTRPAFYLNDYRRRPVVQRGLVTTCPDPD